MKIGLLIFATLFSFCSQPQKSRLIIPNRQRDEIYTRFINPITDKYGIQKLREVSLLADDLEIRVWFSVMDNLDGLILRRNGGDWSATAIKEVDCRQQMFGNHLKNKDYQLGEINLPVPKSGWESTWKKMNTAGIINLPNSNYIPVPDEGTYILETNINGEYRIRFYGGGEKSSEAEQMRKIGEIIAEEFSLPNFKTGSMCKENDK